MDTTQFRISMLCFGLLAGTATGVACTSEVKNEQHCFYNGGNSACDDRYDGELPYCGTVCLDRDGNPPSPNGDGCVDFVPDDGCYSPCGDKDVTEDDSCLDVADTGSTQTEGPESTQTGMTEGTEGPSTTLTTASGSEADTTTSGPVGCMDASECTDASAPLCLDEMCVACTESDAPNMSCAEKDATLGVCGNDGACVECTSSQADACGGATPVCDAETSACVACETHEECGGAACAFETGECLDTCVLEVDGDGGGDAMTVQLAVNMVGDGEGCTIVVHEKDDLTSYQQAVTIDGGKQIGLLAAAGENPVMQGSGGPGITLSEGSVLYADRMQLRGNTGGPGLSMQDTGTVAWMDRCQVAQNTGGGITVSDGAELHLRNSMVGGGSADDSVGVLVESATLQAVYASISGADDGFGGGTALRCTGAASVSVRNSVIVKTGSGTEIECEDADVSYSATETATLGTGNVTLGNVMANWFVSVASDLHLNNPPAALTTTAQWQSGDPATDIDGDLRPTEDGAADYAGADVP